MPREEGVVIKELPEGALVRIKRSDACHSCPSGTLCHIGKTGERDVMAANPVNARKGQRVEIEIRDGLLLKASFIVYFLPIIGLILGALAGKWIVMQSGIPVTQDTGAVIGGLTSLVTIFIVIRIVSRRSSSMKTYQPRIVKTTSEEEVE